MSDNGPMTESQVRRYLKRINFPSSRSSPFISNYQNLCIIVACHLSYIPWENVTLQYSKDYLMFLEKKFKFREPHYKETRRTLPGNAPVVRSSLANPGLRSLHGISPSLARRHNWLPSYSCGAYRDLEQR